MAEIKHLAKVGDEQGLRTCLDWLMGHDGGGVGSSSQNKQEQVYLMDGQLKKNTLLREALEAIKSNLHLQRLYAEYNDQLRSTDEVKEIDRLLDVWKKKDVLFSAMMISSKLWYEYNCQTKGQKIKNEKLSKLQSQLFPLLGTQS
mgnify:CR=1 FL=1